MLERCISLKTSGLIAAALALAACVPSWAGPIVTVQHRTKVAAQVELLYQDPGADPTTQRSTVQGDAAGRIVWADRMSHPEGDFGVGMVIDVKPISDVKARVRIETEVQRGNSLPVLVQRQLDVQRSRLVLVEGWSNRPKGQRLMIALTVDWEQVPVVHTVAPGVEPVEVIVEMLERTDKSTKMLERHRLGGIVGSPVSYTFQRRTSTPGETNSSWLVEITPLSVRGDTVDLAIRVRNDGRSPYSTSKSLDVTARERLPVAHSFDVPLPDEENAPGLLVRVTPYF